MRTLTQYLVRTQRTSVILLFSLTVLVSSFEGVGAGLLIPIVESLGTSQELNGTHWVSSALARGFAAVGLPFTLLSILAVGLILFATQQALLFARARVVARTRGRVVFDLRASAFANLMQADIGLLDRRNSGHLVNGVIVESERAGAAVTSLAEVLTLSGVMAMYLLVALFVSWPLTLLAVLLLGALSAALHGFNRTGGKTGWQVTEANNALHAAAMEYLGGIRVIKAFGSERFATDDFTRRARQVRQLTTEHTVANARVGFVQEVTLFAALVLIVYVALTFFRLSPALLIAFLFILYRLSPRAVTINRQRHQLTAHLPGFMEVTRLIDETRRSLIPSGRVAVEGLQRGIEFERVSFDYERGQAVLQAVSFVIEKGQTTVFVGSSGAGKTTVVDLLLRLYDAAEGRILVDGVDLRQLDLAQWRRSIAIVQQDTFLFNDTIWNNILIGRPDASSEQVLEAAGRAHVDDFVAPLPEGYQTVVGDRGVRLSGGQRQRLALARAFLREPDILILDEPTSALDAESEAFIRQSLAHYRGNRTVIIVAHRLATIRAADKVIVLEDGRVVEQGDHETLLRNGHQYARYHQLQVGG